MLIWKAGFPAGTLGARRANVEMPLLWAIYTVPHASSPRSECPFPTKKRPSQEVQAPDRNVPFLPKVKNHPRYGRAFRAGQGHPRAPGGQAPGAQKRGKTGLGRPGKKTGRRVAPKTKVKMPPRPPNGPKTARDAPKRQIGTSLPNESGVAAKASDDRDTGPGQGWNAPPRISRMPHMWLWSLINFAMDGRTSQKGGIPHFRCAGASWPGRDIIRRQAQGRGPQSRGQGEPAFGAEGGGRKKPPPGDGRGKNDGKPWRPNGARGRPNGARGHKATGWRSP
jgi:hypothetical protein